MLENLFEIKCLNYDKLIRLYYRNLNLDEKGAMILITILDYYSNDKALSAKKIAESSGYLITDVENTLASLLERDYIEIFLDILPNGKEIEAYRFLPLFKELESIIDKDNSKTKTNTSNISIIISMIEEEVKRTLTASELETIKSWFDDGKSFDEIKSTINKLKISYKVTVKEVEKSLYKVQPKAKPNQKIKEVFDLMGRK